MYLIVLISCLNEEMQLFILYEIRELHCELCNDAIYGLLMIISMC
jgi:hypothetical protein